MLARALPGSAPSLVSYDLTAQTVNASFAEGVDPAYVDSYTDYYGAISPWLPFWGATPYGAVKVSERDAPARQFANTEFYVDWLMAHGGIEAAAGMWLDTAPGEVVQVAWHYDITQAARYDIATETILERLKPRLREALRAAAILREGLESGRRLGPLIERIDGWAILVGRDRRIREANTEAERALGRGEVVAGTGGLLSLREPAAQRWLEETIVRLIDRASLAETTHVFSVGDRIFRVNLTLAPGQEAQGLPLLLKPHPLVLVVAKLLVGGNLRLDHAGLRFAFGLSAAEIRLCDILVNGHSLADAARTLGVSEGTIRQRVKTVFHKTRTHRQGELIATLMRFSEPE